MAFLSGWNREEKIAGASFLVSAIAIVISVVGGCVAYSQTTRSLEQSEASLKQSEESLRLSRETVENEYRKPASLTISLGRDLFLAAKPYVGVSVSIHNSGAQPGVVARGTLHFSGHPLTLVMMSPQTESWTYGKNRDEIPMRFSYFAPITVEKSASISIVIWFTRDMGNARLFTATTQPLELQLFDDTNPTPVATKNFSVTLTDANVAFVYRKGNETTQLPVVITP